MKILITGATGFVGYALVNKLLEEKSNRLTIITTKNENSLPQELYEDPKHEIVPLELNGDCWKYAISQDLVYHLAANNDTQSEDKMDMFKSNYRIPVKLFTEAYGSGCRNFVYASSTAIYGNAEVPYKEDITEPDPLTYYAQSKLKFDEFAMDFAKKTGASIKGVRFCNVYGPGEDHKGKRMSMIGQLIQKTNISDEKPTVRLFKHGEQERDWVYVEDAVLGLILAAKYNGSGIFNIASGVSVSFNKIVETLSEILKKEIDIDYVDCPFGESYQSHTCCSIEKASSQLGYSPVFNIRSGIEKYIQSRNFCDS